MMTRIFTILLAACAVGTASADCLDSRIQNLTVNDFTVNNGSGLMTITMTFDFGDIDLPSNQQMVLTPVMKYGSDSVCFPSIFLNGRNAQLQYERGLDTMHPLSSDIVLQRRNGKPQTYEYAYTVASTQWMDKGLYEAYIREEDCGCGKQAPGGVLPLELPVCEVAMIPEMEYIRPAAKPKTYELSKTSYIDFVVDRTELNPKYRRNPIELDSIKHTIELVQNDPDLTIDLITIHGFASPESPYEHNTELAQGRAKTLKEYVGAMMSIPAEKMTSTYTPEDWDGLCRFLSEDYNLDLPHRQEILQLASNRDDDPDRREWLIKSQYPDEYKAMLAQWYPALRHSDYTIKYTVRAYTREEAIAAYKDPAQRSRLSLNELYMVAEELEPGTPEFNDVMMTAVTLFPEDSIANLNAAVSLLEAGEPQQAERYLNRTKNTPEALNARGAYEYIMGNREAAKRYFELSTSSAAATNLRTLFRDDE